MMRSGKAPSTAGGPGRAPHKSLRSGCSWRGEGWVGTIDKGLCQLRGDELVSIEENQTPDRLDPRGDLLMVQGEKVAATSDGLKFRAWKLDRLSELWSQQPAPA